LRRHVFTLPAQAISHARTLLARLVDRAERAIWIVAARLSLWQHEAAT
jgi:hypothetical protein